MSHTFTPEISRAVRNNMRLHVHILLMKYMKTQSSNVVKLAEFKKWVSTEYKSGNPDVSEAQKYYVKAGFTGKETRGYYSSGTYGFWEYERLERWLSKIESVSISKQNNRIILTQKLASHVG